MTEGTQTINGAKTFSDFTLSATDAVIASGDHLVIADNSNSDKIKDASLTFGTDTTSFLANNGTWQTPSISYSQVLTAIFGRTNTTAWGTALSVSGVVPGTYQIIVSGRWNRAAFGNSRFLECSLTFDNATNVTIQAVASFHSITQSVTGSTTLSNNIFLASSTVGALDTYFRSNTGSGSFTNAPFSVVGRITIGGATNKTVNFSFRQATASGGSVQDFISIGSSMILRRLS
jgi:hypothetical protein